jgi:hypothetical protein
MLRTPDGHYIIIQRPPGFFSTHSHAKNTRGTEIGYSANKNAKVEKFKSQETAKTKTDGWNAGEGVKDKSEERRGRGTGNEIQDMDGTAGAQTNYTRKGSNLGINFNLHTPRTPFQQEKRKGGKSGSPSEGGGGGPEGSPQEGIQEQGPQGGRRSSQSPPFVWPYVGAGGGIEISSGTTNEYKEFSENRNIRYTRRWKDWNDTTGSFFNYQENWGETTTSTTKTGTQFSASENYGVNQNFKVGNEISFIADFNIDNLALKIYADRHPELSKLDERIRYTEAEKRLQRAFYTGDKEEIKRYYEAVNEAKTYIENVMPQPAQEVLTQGPKMAKEVPNQMNEINKKISPKPKKVKKSKK